MAGLFAELISDPIGRWFVYIGVVVFFMMFALFMAAFIRNRLNEIAKNLGLVKHEVKNDHNTNMRADVDKIASDIDRVHSGVKFLITNQENLQLDVRQLRKDLSATDERIDDIEITQDRKGK